MAGSTRTTRAMEVPDLTASVPFPWSPGKHNNDEAVKTHYMYSEPYLNSYYHSRNVYTSKCLEKVWKFHWSCTNFDRTMWAVPVKLGCIIKEEWLHLSSCRRAVFKKTVCCVAIMSGFHFLNWYHFLIEKIPAIQSDCHHYQGYLDLNI